ncbi:hypothetical protein Mapa_007803 [Marchantia paleacea]|nr:hypothetical protein Mapa_007803 [Marchantia paleacea]
MKEGPVDGGETTAWGSSGMGSFPPGMWETRYCTRPAKESRNKECGQARRLLTRVTTSSLRASDMSLPLHASDHSSQTNRSVIEGSLYVDL